MSPYKLIKGSDKNLAAFEEQVANAMLDGYDLANDLVVQLKTTPSGETEAVLFQAMVCEEVLEFDEDDDEEDEEIDEYEEEAQLS
jgi:hypothetical protein